MNILSRDAKLQQQKKINCINCFCIKTSYKLRWVINIKLQISILT